MIQKNGMLVIKHCSIYNCIKVAAISLNKLQTIQIFRLNKTRANCKIFLLDQKISQSSSLTRIFINEPGSERPDYIQINTIKDKDA